MSVPVGGLNLIVVPTTVGCCWPKVDPKAVVAVVAPAVPKAGCWKIYKSWIAKWQRIIIFTCCCVPKSPPAAEDVVVEPNRPPLVA